MRSPIRWFGGKGNMVSKLLRLIPPHREYVEVFGGGASLLFAKEPALVETYNDIDEGLTNFFRVLQSPEKFARFYNYVSWMPYSRVEYNYCRKTWGTCLDEVERAYRWFVVARMSFSGRFGNGWGNAISESCRGIAQTASRWMSIVELLPVIHARVMRVQIECSDWRNILARYNSETTLAYLDPPYIPETRKSGKYKHEMTEEDHRELVDAVLEYPGMVMLSGYDHEAYSPLEKAGWTVNRFRTACHAAGRTRATGMQGNGSAMRAQARTECVWRNPACFREELKLF